MFGLKRNGNRVRKGLSMKRKFVFGMSSIAAILLLSSIISVLEYRRMSNYVSDLIASNIKSLNLSQRLASITDNYNLQILAMVGDNAAMPVIDKELFLDHCDSLKQSLSLRNALPLADSVAYAYSAYMLTSMELQSVISYDFIDSRQWYFERLQPRFNILKENLERLNEAIYKDLEYNSVTFQESFYRSIVPGVVSVAAGLMLVLLLLYFFLCYFVNPVAGISEGISAYLSGGRKSGFADLDGDDEVASLGKSVEELIDENNDLKRRLKMLKGRLEEQV